MNRRNFCQLIGAGAIASLLPASGAAQNVAPRQAPNIIVIFTDDQGYGDMSVYGSKTLRTPNWERMAREGVKFSDFYVAQGICTPSRAALLTGCYPRRNTMERGVFFPNDARGLHPDEITIADLLKTRGYATACIGKWHLGDKPQFLPTRQGFDSYFGIPYSNDMGPSAKQPARPILPLMRDEAIIEQPVQQETLTRRYTEESIRFIRDNKKRPFFLYLAHTFPHVPLFASPAFRGKSQGGLYGDAIEELDWSTGQILDALRREGLDENTLVIFTSDNGPWLQRGKDGGSAGPLRGGKLSVWEGGMRVPCLMRWPGRLPAGAVCSQLATTMDLLPTFAQLSGATVPQDRVIDGRSIWNLMTKPASAPTPHEALFYHDSAGKLGAVRSGTWKLHLESGELYDLRADIGETQNIAAQHPEIVARLGVLAQNFNAGIKANRRPQGRDIPPA